VTSPTTPPPSAISVMPHPAQFDQLFCNFFQCARRLSARHGHFEQLGFDSGGCQ